MDPGGRIGRRGRHVGGGSGGDDKRHRELNRRRAGRPHGGAVARQAISAARGRAAVRARVPRGAGVRRVASGRLPWIGASAGGRARRRSGGAPGRARARRPRAAFRRRGRAPPDRGGAVDRPDPRHARRSARRGDDRATVVLPMLERTRLRRRAAAILVSSSEDARPGPRPAADVLIVRRRAPLVCDGADRRSGG